MNSRDNVGFLVAIFLMSFVVGVLVTVMILARVS